MLFGLIVSFLVSFVVCYVLIRFNPLGKWTLDPVSGGVQKFHTKPVPRVGGLALFLSLFVYAVLSKDYVLFLCSLPAFLGGLLEDITKRVGVRERLFLTMLSAALGYFLLSASINRVDLPLFDHLLAFSLFSFAFTLFAVAGVSNAFNIIDGFNGLASGVAILSLLALGYVAHLVGDHHLFYLCLVLCCALLGFFIWNYPQGNIFLGDGGAYLVGFLIAEISVLLVKRNPDVSPWFPLLVVSYPVVESLFSIYRRRLIKKASPTEADRLHLHTLIYRKVKAEDKTLKNSKTSPYLWALSLVGMVPALIFWKSTPILIFMFLTFYLVYLYAYKRALPAS
ncbi:MAG: MraY family glycosyltransferase [Aquificaceae bacterium]